MVEGFDTKLRRSKRLNLLVRQPFPIYICRAIYNSKSRDYNTRVVPIIFPIYIHFYNKLNELLRNLCFSLWKKVVWNFDKHTRTNNFLIMVW